MNLRRLPLRKYLGLNPNPCFFFLSHSGGSFLASLKEMAKFKEPETESDEELIQNQEMESEPEPESESDSEAEKLTKEPSKTAIYNTESLNEKLDDISWPKNINWTHNLIIEHKQEDKVDVNDDLARELAFYTQALSGTRVAFSKFQKLNRPFLRPKDYYAEMVKSDNHMLKIKEKLLFEKKKIEDAEERRKMRENKKISKQVQVEKVKEREKKKKDEIEKVKKWRKQREKDGFSERGAGKELGLGFDEGGERKKRRNNVKPSDRSGGKSDKKNKGRERRDSKFGFGGRKAGKKQNTAETTDDFRGFNKGEGGKRKRF